MFVPPPGGATPIRIPENKCDTEYDVQNGRDYVVGINPNAANGGLIATSELGRQYLECRFGDESGSTPTSDTSVIDDVVDGSFSDGIGAAGESIIAGTTAAAEAAAAGAAGIGGSIGASAGKEAGHSDLHNFLKFGGATVLGLGLGSLFVGPVPRPIAGAAAVVGGVAALASMVID